MSARQWKTGLFRLAVTSEKGVKVLTTSLPRERGSTWGTNMKRILITAIVLVMTATPVKAAVSCKATAYCITGKTASGTYTTAYRTVAGKREWFGKKIWIWLDDGDGVVKAENYLGEYIVEDTGGEPIRAGRVIDIYMKDKADCKVFGSRKILYELER